MKRPAEIADSYPRDAQTKLCDERLLEAAESTLESWAYTLAAAGRDSDAAEALRVAHTILSFRGSFLSSEKS